MTLRKYTNNNNNNNVNENAFFSSTSSSKNRYAALDSAASDHYFPASYKGEAHSRLGSSVLLVVGPTGISEAFQDHLQVLTFSSVGQP